MKMIRKLAKKITDRVGYTITRNNRNYMDSNFEEIYQKCRNYTMASKENCYALYQAVNYIIKNNIHGDFVECGVAKGGSVMLMAETLKLLKVDRKIWLYDTFEGMTEPEDRDRRLTDGTRISKYENKEYYISMEEVKENLKKTDYPESNFIFIKGDVLKTIPKEVPKKISLLRLDTDWYESTCHELKHLFSLLIKQGVIIIDDYGCLAGSKEATDKYFEENKINLLLNRVDFSSRMGIK